MAPAEFATCVNGTGTVLGADEAHDLVERGELLGA